MNPSKFSTYSGPYGIDFPTLLSAVMLHLRLRTSRKKIYICLPESISILGKPMVKKWLEEES